jgi:spermidine synthase
MPPGAATVRLFALSAIALLLELALIRWLGAEIRVFAYFKNLILIACFLGFGVGFHRSRHRSRLGLSVALVVGIVALVAVPPRIGWVHGPQMATRALSNFHGSIFMGDLPIDRAAALGTLALGLLWTLVLFVAVFAALLGYAQRIGADIEALGQERRLQAYSWNVAGSLAGVLAFAALSWLAMPPRAWFLAACLGTIPFLDGARARGAAVAGALLVALALPAAPRTIWSPYQKLEVTNTADGTPLITVNGTGYMILRSFAPDRQAPGADRWLLPYTLHQAPERVLILGAGAGNDASAALVSGARRIVAVEIDREIDRIGRELPPDSPYEDPRVEVIIDDARHYAETTRERFDLIVMSHLDAHTALSGYTNLRLDNYIYTVESLRNCRRLLAPGGLLYLSFWATQDWVAARLEENLRLAFGAPPVSHVVQDSKGVILAHYFATDDPALREAARGLAFGTWRPEQGSPPPASTDDWPYLFVKNRRVPIPMLLVALPLLGVCLLIVTALVRPGSRPGAPTPPDRHFFFLGAAFLLVEVHNVSRLARVFGTTWVVNAWVISGVLLVVLLANLLAARWPGPSGGNALYALLVAGLVVGAFLPVDRLIALPLGSALATLFYTLPLLFASLIFARSFRDAVDAPRALGSNILGATCGGFLELASFHAGLSSLLLIAAGLYALSFARPVGTRRPAAA